MSNARSGVTYAWDFGDSTTGMGSSVVHIYPNEGAYAVSVTASGATGLASNASRVIDVVAAPPSAPTVAMSITAPWPGSTVDFTASSVDPQGAAIEYTWDFMDGTAVTGATQRRTYPAEGAFPVEVVATNSYGRSATNAFVVSVAALPPVIQSIVQSATQTQPNVTVLFDVAASDPQGTAIGYAWSFGDGGTAAGKPVSHVYAAEGAFPVTVTATNAYNRTSASTINVSVVALAPVIDTLFTTTLQPRPNELVTYTAAATDPQGSAIAYAWDFGDGAGASGSQVSHAWLTEGDFVLGLTVSNAYGRSAQNVYAVPVVALPPSAPSLSFDPPLPKPGDSVTLAAQSTDPQGSALVYDWTFGDGEVGVGQSLAHGYAAAGDYAVRVDVTNAFGKSASAGATLAVAYRPPLPPVITPSETTLITNQVATFSVATTDPGGYAVSHAWDFGDGTTAGDSTTQEHGYSAAGSYTLSVTATNTIGLSASASASVAVVAAPDNDQLVVYCTGAACGAVDAATYRGDGIGIWRYRNTTATTAILDFVIDGVMPGQHGMLLFSNGQPTATELPSGGTPTTPVAVPPALAAPVRADEAADAFLASHARMLEENRRLIEELAKSRTSVSFSAAAATAAAVVAAPAVGTTRTWREYQSGIDYETSVAATCPASSGRTIVFWVDPLLSLPAGDLDAYQATFCGSDGGYGRLTALIGDAWGPTPGLETQLIQDSPSLQDVNVVFLNAPSGTGWGGYFWGINNQQSNLNHALVFFVNGPNSIGNRNYYISVLIHELTHMVNCYQRGVLDSVAHDTWLEESSAMMGEDIVGPAVSPSGYNPIRSTRTTSYFLSHGGVSLVNWSTLSSVSYGMGGSFGAFLSRRYGITLFEQIATCGETPDTFGTSYQCVDALIKGFGGDGYADEFARFGATLFGVLGDVAVPQGFGYPSVGSGAYTLQGFDLQNVLSFPPGTATPLGALFPAAAHTYVVDTIDSGAASYGRSGVSVPPDSTLLIVIE